VLRRAGLGQAVKVLHYGLIVATAWAAASVVLRATSLDLQPKTSAVPAAGQDSSKAARPRQGDNDAVILRRNLFGAADVETVDEDGGAAPAGGADLRLRGIASSKGASFAVFENTASGEQNVFAVGDRVFEGPKLVSVDPLGADVLLKGRKRRYEIESDDEALGSPTGSDGADAKTGKGRRLGKPEKAKAKAEKPGKGDKSSKKDKNAPSGVKKTGENAYLVDRREVEHAVANLNEVITQARAVPVMTDGKASGFKLFAIRKGSIFDKIGLSDGDVVQRVNDTELSDPSKAVGLLEEIQSMDQIRVNFVRGGKPRSHTYTIR
jgi:type II secretion system protein C